MVNTRKNSKKASAKVGRAMHEMKEGNLKSGRSRKKVTDKKQAIAIGLSEARKEGAVVQKKSSGRTRKQKSARTTQSKPTSSSSKRKSSSSKTKSK